MHFETVIALKVKEDVVFTLWSLEKTQIHPEPN